MALRWCAAGMLEAGKQFRRVNGHLHLKTLRAALAGQSREAWGTRCMDPSPVRAAAAAAAAAVADACARLACRSCAALQALDGGRPGQGDGPERLGRAERCVLDPSPPVSRAFVPSPARLTQDRQHAVADTTG